jgi:hypothetical protein
VGAFTNSGGTRRTLIETWNGESWTRVSTPNVGNHANALLGVSCVAPAQCVAVGFYLNSAGVARTLVLTRNGGAWTHTGSPNVGNHDNLLTTISCITITGCKAVGNYNTSGGTPRTLIVASHGGSWSHQSSPNVGNRTNFLSSVSCVSSTACKVVGGYITSGGVIQSLVLSWNGTSWSRQSSPNTGTHDNILESVSCVSATSCKAAGHYRASSGASGTLTLSWNGASWSHVTSPNVGLSSVLVAVSCASGLSCKAVGGYLSSSGVVQTLVLSWNGSSWSRQSSPNAGTHDNFLYGVSCPLSTSCQAVGELRSSSGVARTLALWYG